MLGLSVGDTGETIYERGNNFRTIGLSILLPSGRRLVVGENCNDNAIVMIMIMTVSTPFSKALGILVWSRTSGY